MNFSRPPETASNQNEWLKQMESLRSDLPQFGLDTTAHPNFNYSPQARQFMYNNARMQNMLGGLPETADTAALQARQDEKFSDYYRQHLVPAAYSAVAPQAKQIRDNNQHLNLDETKFLHRADPDARDSLLYTDPQGNNSLNVQAVRKQLESTDPKNHRTKAITSNERLQSLNQMQNLSKQLMWADPRSTFIEYASRPGKEASPAQKTFYSTAKGVLTACSSLFLGLSLIASKGQMDFPTLFWSVATLGSVSLFKKQNSVNTFLTSTTYEKMHRLFPQYIPHIVESLKGPVVASAATTLRKKPTEQNKQDFLQKLVNDQTIDSGTAAVLNQLTPGELAYLVRAIQSNLNGSYRSEFNQAIENQINPEMVKNLTIGAKDINQLS